MKLKILLLSTVGLAIVVVAGAYVQAYFMKKAVAKAMDVALAKIARPWSKEAVLERASWALNASPTTLLDDRIRATTILLGDYVALNAPPDCKLYRGRDGFSKREYTYAWCFAPVAFKMKSVGVEMNFVWQQDEWRIDDFKINNN